MLRTLLVCAGLAAAALATPALAQRSTQVGELVVTAEKREGGTPEAPPPHVVVFRRADNLIVDLYVECDTRDRSDRLAELKATLKNVIAAAAADGSIELGVEDTDAGIVIPFKAEALDAMLNAGVRPDTSAATITVKTKINPTDTFDAATGRIDAFIKRIKVVGRSQASRSGDWQLTLITPRQYRGEIIGAIAKDANEAAKAFGPGYAVTITGLERQMAWTRSGPLDLALFIPYTLMVEPLAPGGHPGVAPAAPAREE
jgi:hypothetical protein